MSRELTAWPAVDVVIAARDEAARIGACLAALRRQDYPAELLRVIVVDNGSADTTAQVAREAGARVLTQAKPGAAAARNCGIAACDSALVAFLDAHCEPAADWIARMVEPFADPHVGGCQGAIENRSVDPRVQRYLESSAALANERVRDDTVRGARSLLPWILGGNSLYRRAALIEVGGFDEALLACEDVDLAWRVVLRGYRLEYAAAAFLLHVDPSPWPAFVRKSYAYGRGAARVARRYRPEGAAAGLRPRLFRPRHLETALRSFLYGAGYYIENIRLHMHPGSRRSAVRSGVNERLRLWFRWTDQTRLRISPNAVYWFPDDGVSIAYHLPSRRRHLLASSADFLWRLLARQQPRDAIVEQVVARYGVAAVTAGADLDDLIDETLAAGLIEQRQVAPAR